MVLCIRVPEAESNARLEMDNMGLTPERKTKDHHHTSLSWKYTSIQDRRVKPQGKSMEITSFQKKTKDNHYSSLRGNSI